ncbi:hypothetical protein ACFV23_26280, partial [Streptomyces sp. NPDC059627]
MLEPTEPIEGSEPNTPSDTLPPRRRRRAASRPAGPPAGTEAVAETATPAIPAAETFDSAAEATDEAAETPDTGEIEEAAPAPRTRRRATRRASAPAGAPA